MLQHFLQNIHYFFNKKSLPDFWTTYVDSIKKSTNKPISEIKFVVFDCETSGLNPKTDRILSIGAVTLNNNTIEVKKSFERYLEQEIFKRETVAIHGLLKNGGNYKKDKEEEVIKDFLQYIEGAILIGHHIHFDVACVNFALKRMGLPKLKNKMLDTNVLFKKTKHQVYADVYQKTFSLDEICEELKIRKTDRHTAYGDAYITAMVFFKILSKLNKNKDLLLKDLFYVPKMIY